jgi:hypothetical protein
MPETKRLEESGRVLPGTAGEVEPGSQPLATEFFCKELARARRDSLGYDET